MWTKAVAKGWIDYHTVDYDTSRMNPVDLTSEFERALGGKKERGVFYVCGENRADVSHVARACRAYAVWLLEC